MKTSKLPLVLVGFIFLSNLHPFKSMYEIFIEGIIVQGAYDNCYVTKDKKYIYGGKLKDSLKNQCYVEYTKKFPANDHTFYRIRKINLLKFWRWSEYLFEEKWHQPYQYISNKDFDKLLAFWSRTYNSPNGTLACEEFPDK